MSKTRKILSIVLALVMVLSLFAACAETGTEAETTEAIAGTEAPETEPEVTKDPNYDDDGYLKSKLPEDVKFEGETISISDLPQGIYIVKANGRTTKIIKR